MTCVANDSATSLENASGGVQSGSDVISSSKEDSAGVFDSFVQSDMGSGSASGGNGDWIVLGTSSGSILVWNANRFSRSEIAARGDLVRDAEKMLSRGILSSGYGRVPESYTSPTRRLWPELIINAHCNPVTAVSIRVDVGIVVSASSKQSECLLHDMRTRSISLTLKSHNFPYSL